jgi:hypothetical protein
MRHRARVAPNRKSKESLGPGLAIGVFRSRKEGRSDVWTVGVR